MRVAHRSLSAATREEDDEGDTDPPSNPNHGHGGGCPCAHPAPAELDPGLEFFHSRCKRTQRNPTKNPKKTSIQKEKEKLVRFPMSFPSKAG